VRLEAAIALGRNRCGRGGDYAGGWDLQFVFVSELGEHLGSVDSEPVDDDGLGVFLELVWPASLVSRGSVVSVVSVSVSVSAWEAVAGSM
jgi:hypothetical protein